MRSATLFWVKSKGKYLIKYAVAVTGMPGQIVEGCLTSLLYSIAAQPDSVSGGHSAHVAAIAVVGSALSCCALFQARRNKIDIKSEVAVIAVVSAAAVSGLAWRMRLRDRVTCLAQVVFVGP
jgi:hypothetical protein